MKHSGLTLIALLCMAGALEAQPSTGRHFFAVENLDAGVVTQRGQAGTLGVAFSQLILAPETHYRVWILSAATLNIGRVEVETGPSGSALELPNFVLRRHNQFDKDRDSLPDMAEFIIGTTVDDPDTDDDGILDGAEILDGLDPADGLALGVGIRASVELPGSARDVCIDGDLLVVAHEGGISGFNFFTGMNPITLLRVELPGVAQRVASWRSRIAVACGSAGLVIVDALEPSQATILVQLSPAALGGGEAVAVTAVDGVAYVGTTTGALASVDMIFGTVLDTDTSGTAGAIRDLGFHGDYFYALGTVQLRSFTIDSGAIALVDSASSPLGGFGHRLFVGDGLAVAMGTFGPATFELGAAGEVDLIASPSGANFFFKDAALDTAGIAVCLRGASSLFEDDDLYLYDMSDPAAPETIVDRDGDLLADVIGTPGAALAVEILNGFAVVADYDAGLHVISYRDRDLAGIPPTIALLPGFDPAGVSANRLVRVSAAVTDDVQVRSVEFEVDGALITDAGHPFEARFRTPAYETGTFLVRARAFDTGGNFAWSDDITVTLTPDTEPPRLLLVSPSGVRIGEVERVDCYFSEEIAAGSLDAGAIAIVSAGPDGILTTTDDVPIAHGGPQWIADLLVARVTPREPFGAGRYLVTVASTVADTAGNPLTGSGRRVLVVYADTDVDGDGIADGSLDTDGDGLINAFEVALDSDPLVADFVAGQDGDEDGLADLAELNAGSDPAAIDSDGDGFLDGEEVTTAVLIPGLPPVNFAFASPSVHQRRMPASLAHSQASVENEVAPEATLGSAGPNILSIENESP